MVTLLAAAALAAVSPVAAQPAGAAATASGPAMFVVRDADTTIYLFGTFHALDGHGEWFDHGVRDAFDHSSELVLETLVPERPANAAAVPILAPVYRNWSVAPSASFLAATRMAISAGRARGMQVNNGADMVLRRAAEASGKDVEGLETIESQLTMFERMPDVPAQAPPRAGDRVEDGATMDDLSDAMAEMQSAWKHGQQGVFVRVLDELRRTSPGTYRTLFTERNARWADWVGARMQTPGTVFVAVGAGHLAGRDSLLVRLAELGVESKRVD